MARTALIRPAFSAVQRSAACGEINTGIIGQHVTSMLLSSARMTLAATAQYSSRSLIYQHITHTPLISQSRLDEKGVGGNVPCVALGGILVHPQVQPPRLGLQRPKHVAKTARLLCMTLTRMMRDA